MTLYLTKEQQRRLETDGHEVYLPSALIEGFTRAYAEGNGLTARDAREWREAFALGFALLAGAVPQPEDKPRPKRLLIEVASATIPNRPLQLVNCTSCMRRMFGPTESGQCRECDHFLAEGYVLTIDGNKKTWSPGPTLIPVIDTYPHARRPPPVEDIEPIVSIQTKISVKTCPCQGCAEGKECRRVEAKTYGRCACGALTSGEGDAPPLCDGCDL